VLWALWAVSATVGGGGIPCGGKHIIIIAHAHLPQHGEELLALNQRAIVVLRGQRARGVLERGVVVLSVVYLEEEVHHAVDGANLVLRTHAQLDQPGLAAVGGGARVFKHARLDA